MKRALLLLLIVPLHGQQQTVNNEPFPSARTKINANFTDLYTNKAGNSACPANQYAIQTTTAGVVCASLTSGQLLTALGFTPASSADLSGKQATITGAPGSWPSTFAPTAHAASHASGGGDPVTLTEAQVTSLVSDLAAKAAAGAATTVNGQSCALGSTCTVTADPTSAQFKIRTCEVIVGDPGAASSALADDNDSPASCGNKTGATLTITAVECYANAGTPTVTPIITGGGATSILTGALTCGTGSFASGTLNGTPTQSNGGSIDANITTAGGTAKYIVIRITRTL